MTIRCLREACGSVLLQVYFSKQAIKGLDLEAGDRLDVGFSEARQRLALRQTIVGGAAVTIKDEQIVADSGKSRSYVYGRLKLANIEPKVRQACLEEGLGAEIALLIARLPNNKLQREALQRMRHGDEWVSFRTAKLLAQNFTVSLGKASFDLADASMHGGACSTCRFLACNDPDLVDLAADVCINRQCYAIKTEEQGRRVIALARETGRKVIEGDDAKDIASYPGARWFKDGTEEATDEAFTRKDPDTGEETSVSWAQAIAELPSEQRNLLRPALLVHPDKPTESQEVILPDAQAEVLRLHGIEQDLPDPARPSHTTGGFAFQGGGGQDLSTWAPDELAVRDGMTYQRLVREVLLRVLETPRTASELRLVLKREVRVDEGFGTAGVVLGWEGKAAAARAAAQESDDSFDEESWYSDRIDELDADQAAALLVAISVEEFLFGGAGVTQRSAARTVALAKTYGVDVLALSGQDQTDDTGCAGEDQTDATPSGAVGDLFAGVNT